MSDTTSSKILRHTVVAGAAATAAFAGLAAAQAVLAPALAQQIVVQPPPGAPLTFADLVQKVSPAVVSIQVTQQGRGPIVGEDGEIPPEWQDFLRRFPQARPREATAVGSGFFIDGRGTVVTNHHVVEDADDITVRLSDGREFKAEVIGSDEATDLAVLRLSGAGGETFPFVQFDSNANLRRGDWVVAVGNPFGLEGTATAGIVSAIGRRNIGNSALADFIQIDAPINRGNSGGPTFDLRGRVVGVNSAIFSPTGGNVGIGFAISSQTADNIVRQIVSKGRVTRGWLGATVQAMDEDLARANGLQKAEGALVAQLVPNGPAARSGLRQGDVVLRMDGEPVEDQSDLTRKIAGAAVGANVRLEVLRDGRRQTINVRLGERPSEQQLLAADAGTITPAQPPQPKPPAAQAPVRKTLGAQVRPLTPVERSQLNLPANGAGVVILALDPDSPLADPRKGVGRGDIIIAVGDREVRSQAELDAAINSARAANRPIRLQVRSAQGPSRFVAVDLGR